MREDQRRLLQGLLQGVFGALFIVLAWTATSEAQANTTVPRDSALTVRFFDVGQADAILISTPEGRHVLVDGGRDSRVVKELVDLGVDSLDLVIASHMHADHIVGLEAAMQALTAALVMDNGSASRTRAAREFREAARLAHMPYVVARDTAFVLGGVRIQVMTSPLHAANTSENNRSLVVRVEFGDFSVLLPGDAEREELQALVARGLQSVSVLKAAHHGALNGVSPGWMQALAPKAVVISVGRGNFYGHPAPMALRYYASGGRRVYRTDRDGTVVIRGKHDGSFAVNVSTP